MKNQKINLFCKAWDQAFISSLFFLEWVGSVLALGAISLFFSVNAGADWPWPAKTIKNPTYQLKLNTQAMNFFNENKPRYFAGADVTIQDSLFNVQAGWTYSLSERHHYFRPQQGALKLKADGGHWVIGRKIMEWDWADSFWNRTLWQGAYMDDALRPKSAGLTGVFRDFEYEGGQTNLFGSFLFIPNSTFAFESKDGEIVSKSPWFTAPPHGKIGSTSMKPFYILNSPEWKDFLQFSLGGRAEYRNFYFSYIYKPMNKIKVKSQISLDLSKEPTGDSKKGYPVDIPLDPVVVQHHLASFGFTLKSSDWFNKTAQDIEYQLKTSITYNHPETHTVENNTWVFFQPKKEWHISVKGLANIKDPLEETTLHVAYTHRFERGTIDQDPLTKALPNVEQQFFRDDLFEFSQSVSAGLVHQLKFHKNFNAQVKARLIYSALNEYFLFCFYSSLTYKDSFSVFFSSDLLFAQFPFSSEQTKQNIGIYTNKSRIFGGISYAF